MCEDRLLSLLPMKPVALLLLLLLVTAAPGVRSQSLQHEYPQSSETSPVIVAVICLLALTLTLVLCLVAFFLFCLPYILLPSVEYSDQENQENSNSTATSRGEKVEKSNLPSLQFHQTQLSVRPTAILLEHEEDSHEDATKIDLELCKLITSLESDVQREADLVSVCLPPSCETNEKTSKVAEEEDVKLWDTSSHQAMKELELTVPYSKQRFCGQLRQEIELVIRG